MLGMTPAQYRAGGVVETIRFAVGQTSLGALSGYAWGVGRERALLERETVPSI